MYNAYNADGYVLDHLSVYDWIETRVPGGHSSALGQLLDVAYNIEYGAETTDQSALNLIYLLGYQPRARGFEIFGESDELYHLAGGNEGLPRAIAAALPASIDAIFPLSMIGVLITASAIASARVSVVQPTVASVPTSAP